MRKLASFTDPDVARALCEVLYTERIDSDLRESPDRTLSVWVVSEADMARAQTILERIQSLPNASKEARARAFAERERAAAPSDERLPQPPVPTARKPLLERAKESPVTFALIATCIAISLATLVAQLFGRSPNQLVEFLQIASFERGGPYLRSHAYNDVLHGQVWRLITPIFLHFGLLHLVFNMFWLNDLGAPTERFQGSWRYALFVLWSAAVSNIAQYEIDHASTFGGMSGVVYAFVGYLWARGRADPQSGIYLPGRFVWFFIGWMALGFSSLLDQIFGRMANYCHLGGFVAGAVYGYIAALIARRRRARA